MGTDTLEHGYYKHHKGGLYKVTGIRKQSEDSNIMLVDYENLKGEKYSKTLNEFKGSVFVGRTMVKRYEFMGTELPQSTPLHNIKEERKGDKIND